MWLCIYYSVCLCWSNWLLFLPCRDNSSQFQHIIGHRHSEGDKQKKPRYQVCLPFLHIPRIISSPSFPALSESPAAMTESILIRSSGISQQKVLLNGQCMIVVIMSKSRKLRINPSNTKLPWISCLLMIYSVTLPAFSHKSFLLYFFCCFHKQNKNKIK